MALALGLKLSGMSTLNKQKILERTSILDRWNREISGDPTERKEKTGEFRLGENMAWIELVLEDDSDRGVKDITVEVSVNEDNDAELE